MIIPIANAIFDEKIDIEDFYFPKKNSSKSQIENLSFRKVDKKIFPVFKIMNRVNEYFSTPIIINAANEVLVYKFLNKKIPFLAISRLIKLILNDRNYKKYDIKVPRNLSQINLIDSWAKNKTLELIKNFMNKFIIFFSIIILFSNLLRAETVNKIEINGNKRISDETIKIYGGIENNKNYSEKDLNKILENIYSTNFFKNVDVKVLNNTLFIELEEHPVINQLIVTGEKRKSLKDQIKKVIFSKQKGSYIKSFVTQDVEKIKSLYSSIGFNSASVDIKIKKIDEQK